MTKNERSWVGVAVVVVLIAIAAFFLGRNSTSTSSATTGYDQTLLENKAKCAEAGQAWVKLHGTEGARDTFAYAKDRSSCLVYEVSIGEDRYGMPVTGNEVQTIHDVYSGDSLATCIMTNGNVLSLTDCDTVFNLEQKYF